jgi:hypothetical protein
MEEAMQAMILKRFGGNEMGAKPCGKRRMDIKTRSATRKIDGLWAKKYGAAPLNKVEEVNIFLTDGQIMHFITPTVSYSQVSKMYILKGKHEVCSVDSVSAPISSFVHQLKVFSPPNLSFFSIAKAFARNPESNSRRDGTHVL